MRRYAYGRQPARHTPHTRAAMFIMGAALDPLGDPPSASRDYLAAVTVPWGVMLNDKLACCTASDSGHTLMLRTANNGTIVVPTDDQIEAFYSASCGYVDGDPSTDNGGDEIAVCEYLVTNGLLGHKADAFGTLDYTNYNHIKWCIELFGHCRFGLNLPGYAEDLFDAGQIWDVQSTGDQSTEGHDVPAVKYVGPGLYSVITWGREQIVTQAFLIKYLEEAHNELNYDWIAAQGNAPSGFNLAALASKMTELNS